MHLVDGLIEAPMVVGCSTVAAAGIAVGLRALPADRLPQAALCGAVFFVASLIHIPVGPSSVHLLMGGLAGFLLGWAAVPVIFVALLFQAVFLGFGGITTLGVNTVIMTGPAVLAGLAGRAIANRPSPRSTLIGGAVAGGGAIVLGTLAVSTLLTLSGEAFAPLAKALIVAHLPVVVIEAVATAAAVRFLARVRPDTLGGLIPQSEAAGA